MKFYLLITFLLLIIFVNHAIAETKLTAHILILKDISLPIDAPTIGTFQETVFFNAKDKSFDYTDNSSIVTVDNSDQIIIRFEKFIDSNTREFISIGDIRPKILITHNEQSKSITLDFKYETGKEIQINISYVSKEFVIKQVYGRALYSENPAPYKGLKNEFGFWAPIGLFSTNFQSQTEGIEIAVLPIGIAWGGKVYWGKKRQYYIGFSVMGNILLTSKSYTDINGVVTEKKFITALTMGGLVDVSDALYLGLSYTFDTRVGQSSENRLMGVFGFGLRALDVFK